MSGRFLVTGCGRSGTQFIAHTLNASGVPCRHEQVFTPTDVGPWGPGEGESSWFAAAMLRRLPHRVPVVHVVRDPRDVAASLYRLGLFTTRSWRLVVKGRPVRLVGYLGQPKMLCERIRYVKAIRQLLRDTTPEALEPRRELDRIYRYWIEWNQLIESEVGKLDLPYLRIQLENIDWSAMEAHIGHVIGGERALRAPEGSNRKLGYPPRITDIVLPDDVVNLAQRYGY